MEKTTFLKLLVLFLGFSYVLSSTATRTLKSDHGTPSAVQDFLAQEAAEVIDSEEFFGVEGRMDMEKTDYPGTGANNHHDPKTPGRA